MLDFLVEYFNNLLNTGYDKIFVGEQKEEKTVDIINYLNNLNDTIKRCKN